MMTWETTPNENCSFKKTNSVIIIIISIEFLITELCLLFYILYIFYCYKLA